MTTRGEGLRSQVQDIVKQAVVQMDSVRGLMVRTVAERLDLDVNALRGRRDAVLRNVSKQSARLAEQDVPMPNVVRSTLGRVNNMLDGLIDQLAEQPAEAAASESVVKEAPEKAAKTSRRGSGTSRPRKSPGKDGARKPRRQPATN